MGFFSGVGILSIVVAVMIFVFVKIKFSGGTGKKDVDSFIKEEREANLNRVKELPEDIFINVNTDNLPKEITNDEISNKMDFALRKAELPMVRFEKKLSNLEIKQRFGINNLEKIIMYEEHLNMYVMALNDWANVLIENDYENEGELVLLEAVNLGSEFTKTYTMLLELYKKSKSKRKTQKLIENIESGENIQNEIFKQKIINQLESEFRTM